MVIYFLRHANAGQKHFSDPAKDEKRPIDKLGEDQSHDVGRALAAIGVSGQRDHFQPAYASNADRRDCVAGDWARGKNRDSIDALRPEATFEKFKALLNRHKDKLAIMVVGHDPSMTEFVNRVLSGGSAAGSDRNEEGRRGQSGKRVCAGPPCFEWCLPPKVVQKIQRSSAKRSRPKTDLK